MNYSRIMLVIALLLGTGVAGAAPRITAKVDTVPGASLTAEEQRAVSVAAGRLLRHAYDARVALEAKDTKKAADEVALSEKLVRIIENAMPSATVKARITSGELSYEDEDTVKPTIIPIYDELDKVTLVAPLHYARAEKSKQRGEENGAPAAGVADDELRDTRVTLDLERARAGLQLAREKLDKGDAEAAGHGLEVVLDSVQFAVVTVDVPLHRAQENLMLAKAALERGDKREARALLAEVDEDLEAYAKDASKTREKAIDELRKEMKALSADLDNKANDKGLAKTIEGWWDRISELVQ